MSEVEASLRVGGRTWRTTRPLVVWAIALGLVLCCCGGPLWLVLR